MNMFVLSGNVYPSLVEIAKDAEHQRKIYNERVTKGTFKNVVMLTGNYTLPELSMIKLEECMSATTIDNGIYAIKKYLMDKYGCDAADREIYALEWYINTGRASTTFIKRVFAVKPFIIARILHKHSGCEDDAIRAIKVKIGYKEEN